MCRSREAAALAVLAVSVAACAQTVTQSPVVPDAIVDLTTVDGLRVVNGQWRTTVAPLVEVQSTTRDGQPAMTHDLALKAAAADFDDSSWSVLDPEEIHKRLGASRVSFQWFRIAITVPERIGQVQTPGATLVLDTTVDDYAEVWVDGRLPLTLGASGGGVIRGWNAPSRVLLTDHAEPGRTIHVSIFAANGPLSDPPSNFIWLRDAVLDVYRPDRLANVQAAPLKIVKLSPGLEAIIPPGTKLEKLASGFKFTEGPLWHPDGFLLFSDPNQNVIHRYAPITGEVSVFMANSGFTGAAGTPDIAMFGQPGSNGLAIDREGRLTICQHGNRRVVRVEKNGGITVLADRFGGKRLNSPNDCVYRSDGTLFFTDPPFGLPKFHDDPRREQEHQGVYCVSGLSGGTPEVKQISTELRGPNGLAFSPDERYLYVSNWDERRKIIMRYECAPDGSLTRGSVFFSMQDAPEPEALDGLKVDRAGNLFASGPGGVWIINAAGNHLGTLECPELPANMAWGGIDGRWLYLTARSGLYRLRVGSESGAAGSTGAR